MTERWTDDRGHTGATLVTVEETCAMAAVVLMSPDLPTEDQLNQMIADESTEDAVFVDAPRHGEA